MGDVISDIIGLCWCLEFCLGKLLESEETTEIRDSTPPIQVLGGWAPVDGDRFCPFKPDRVGTRSIHGLDNRL